MGDPRPINARRLNEAIRRLGGGDEGFVAKRSLMANAIVGQLLPNGAVKGGSALKLRFGDSATRATSDLDAALRRGSRGVPRGGVGGLLRPRGAQGAGQPEGRPSAVRDAAV